MKNKQASNEETSTRKKPKLSFDKATVAAPDFCTDPSNRLSRKQVASILTPTDVPNVTVLMEKDLVGKGTKKLYKIDNLLVHYYEGRKCVKKDRVRIEAMFDAAKEEQTSNGDYILLAAESDICKRNTLPEFCSAGYIVQRAGGAAGADGSSDKEEEENGE